MPFSPDDFFPDCCPPIVPEIPSFNPLLKLPKTPKIGSIVEFPNKVSQYIEARCIPETGGLSPARVIYPRTRAMNIYR
jgi:hypothetical protein